MSVTTSSTREMVVETGRRVRRYDSSPEALERLRTARLHRLHAQQRLLSLLPPCVLGLLLLLGWYASTTYGHINSLILPTPAAVFRSLVDGLLSGALLSNAWFSMQESLLGFLCALLISLPLGYGIAKSRLLAATFQPYLAACQAIPAIVIAPFLYLWFGPSILAVIVICLLVVMFPLVMNTVLGIQTIEPALLEAARLEGAAGWSLLAYLEFPLALPAVLTAVRTSLTLSITGAIVGEFVCTPDRGLGGLAVIAQGQYNMALLFATVLVMALLAALYYSVSWLLMKLARAIY